MATIISSLKVLRDLLNVIESKSEDLSLTPSEIEVYLKHMVRVAGVPEGYHELCWKVGEWLLLFAEERGSDLFDQYGYSVISLALAASLKASDLPYGLGWYIYGFLPSEAQGDIMHAVLTHPDVTAVISESMMSGDLFFDITIIDPNDQVKSRAVIEFLSSLHRCGIEFQTELKWAATMMRYISVQNLVRPLAIRYMLEVFVRHERFISAFYWLQLYLADIQEEEIEDVIFQVMCELMYIIEGMDDSSHDLIARLTYNEKIIPLIYISHRTQIFFSITCLRLVIMKNTIINSDFLYRCIDVLWDNYPNLTKLLSFLARWASGMQTVMQASGLHHNLFDYLTSIEQRRDELNQLKEVLNRIPNYRNNGRAFEVWKECKANTFVPIVSLIESCTHLDEIADIKKQIDQLDPFSLIRNTGAFSLGGNALKVFNHNTQQMIANDLQNYILQLEKIVQLSEKVQMVNNLFDQIKYNISWPHLERECENLETALPTISNFVVTHLRPMVIVISNQNI